MATPSKRKAEEAIQEDTKDRKVNSGFTARANEAWSLVNTSQTPVTRQINSERDLSIEELTECYRIFAQALENNPGKLKNRSSIPIGAKTWKDIFLKQCYDLPPPATTWPIHETYTRPVWHGDVPIGFIDAHTRDFRHIPIEEPAKDVYHRLRLNHNPPSITWDFVCDVTAFNSKDALTSFKYKTVEWYKLEVSIGSKRRLCETARTNVMNAHKAYNRRRASQYVRWFIERRRKGSPMSESVFKWTFADWEDTVRMYPMLFDET